MLLLVHQGDGMQSSTCVMPVNWGSNLLSEHIQKVSVSVLLEERILYVFSQRGHRTLWFDFAAVS